MSKSLWLMRTTSLLILMGASVCGATSGPLKLNMETFVALPDDVRHPEGLTSNPRTGELYVGTFDAREPAATRNNVVLRYSQDGRLLAVKKFGQTPLTGLAFFEEKLYILNFGSSTLQRMDASFNELTKVEDLVKFPSLSPTSPSPREVANPDGSRDVIQSGSSGFPAINGMVFDSFGNLFVSDSFQGAILRVDNASRCKTCEVRTVSRDPLLATANALPFGANGLALDEVEHMLYVTNAGDGRLLRMKLPAGPVTVVAESLPGADGLLASAGLYWVAANQADTIFGVDKNGKVKVRAGEFEGIDSDGAPLGLLFPASTAVSGPWMVVSNLALPLTSAIGDEWEELVTRWTLVRFRLPKDVTASGER